MTCPRCGYPANEWYHSQRAQQRLMPQQSGAYGALFDGLAAQAFGPLGSLGNSLGNPFTNMFGQIHSPQSLGHSLYIIVPGESDEIREWRRGAWKSGSDGAEVRYTKQWTLWDWWAV